LQTLKEKNRSPDSEQPRSRKRTAPVDVGTIWIKKKSLKDEEMKVKERELQLRERELSLQEKRVQQADEVNRAQFDMMQKQMQQMADLISVLVKNSK